MNVPLQILLSLPLYLGFFSLQAVTLWTRGSHPTLHVSSFGLGWLVAPNPTRVIIWARVTWASFLCNIQSRDQVSYSRSNLARNTLWNTIRQGEYRMQQSTPSLWYRLSQVPPSSLPHNACSSWGNLAIDECPLWESRRRWASCFLQLTQPSRFMLT